MRKEIAARIAAKIRELDLCTPYGGTPEWNRRQEGRGFYCVGFSKPRNLDGTVSIWGPTFILVKYQTRYQFLAAKDRHLFTSEADVLEFLEALHHLDSDRAAAVIAKARK